jgi:hypothetical protein
VWVTGTGAFLLFAAAAVFTAVRWDQIPDAAKLAALVGATGACVLGGRGLRPTLPASAGALFHLGAFLVPIDVAALAVRADLDWSLMVLLQGAVATVTFGWAAVVERSVVLRWGFAAAVVVLAAGVGATTVIPAPLALAALAVAALAVGRRDAALGWSALAGLAPLLAFLEGAQIVGAGVLGRLGLSGHEPRVLAVLTGVTAAAVLGIEAKRRQDVGLALLGVLVAGMGTAVSWTGLSRAGGDDLVALALAFLAVEAAAHLTRRDPFWRRPTEIVARLFEIVAGFATVTAGLIALLAAEIEVRDPRGALACALLAAGWAAADLRTDGRGRLAASFGVTVATVAAVGLGTSSATTVALTWTAFAVAAVLVGGHPGGATRRPGAATVAVVGAIAGPLAAGSGPVAVTVATGIVGALSLSEAAVRRSWDGPEGEPGRLHPVTGGGWALAAAALIPGAIAVADVAHSTGHRAAALIAGAVLATALAVWTDRGHTASPWPSLGTPARLGSVAILWAAAPLPPVQVGLVALTVALLAAADALRAGRPELALGTSVALPMAVGALCHSAGLNLPSTGVALTVAAAVMAGLGSQLGNRWSAPVVAAVALSIGAGLTLASADPTALADAVMVSGGVGLATAIGVGSLLGVYFAGATVTAGIWMRLADASVVASEPYLLPVAVLLIIAGLRARSIGISSWVAYVPTVGLLGGSALLERLAGGPGWHAVAAGTVAVVAVAAGGARRLAAPLLLGTALLVALVGYETLAVTSTLPTWTWLALGGSLLLGAGVAMERRDVGPLETGKRLVDVISQGYR